jgi:hypothetical protein
LRRRADARLRARRASARAVDGALTTPRSGRRVRRWLAHPLAHDAANIYWFDSCDGSIWGAPVSGGAPLRPAKGEGIEEHIAVAGPYLYYSTSANAIFRVAR